MYIEESPTNGDNHGCFLLTMLIAIAGCGANAPEHAEPDLVTRDAKLSLRLTRSPTRLCELPSIARLLERAAETPGGYWDFQGWIASPTAQAELPKLDATLAPFRAQLLGVAFDDVNQRVIVVVDPDRATDLEPLLANAVELAGVALPIHIQPGCCNSRSELDSSPSLINGRSWHPDAAATTFASFLDPGAGVYVVTFDRWLSEASSKGAGGRPSAQPSTARRPAGPAIAALSKVRRLVRSAVGTPTRLARLDDGEPHFGGAGIDSAPGSVRCTAGPVVRRNGLLGSVSVTHCFSNGDFIFSGPNDYGVAAGAAAYPASDMIRIDPGGQQFIDTIHTDPCCPNARDQSAKSDPALGAMVCFSGMVTKAKCGIRVVALNQSYCDVAGCTTGLAIGERPGVTIAVQGDSGAPVYTGVGTAGATIHGMVVAGEGPSRTFFHTTSQIESGLGVTIAL